jgi:hypothetical protein
MNSEKHPSWILTACLLLGMVLWNLIVCSQDASSLDQGLRELAADELDPSALQFKLAPTNSSFIAMVACMIELDGEEKVLDWLTKINGLGYKEYPKKLTSSSSCSIW